MNYLNELTRRGGPAFPTDIGPFSEEEEIPPGLTTHGLTVHEYFAAKAMQAAITGLLSGGQSSLAHVHIPSVASFAEDMAKQMLTNRPTGDDHE